MKPITKFQCLDSFQLKVFAMFFMLCDHMWATVVPGNQWLTVIGRLAFPIFAFEISEGFLKTKNFKKYFGRLFLFALISEIPFNLMFSGTWFYPYGQNVLFTFCIALVFLRLMKWGKEKNFPIYLFTIGISCILGYSLGALFMTDYAGYGVLTVFLFYIFHDVKFGWLYQLLGMIVIHGYLMSGIALNIPFAGHVYEISQQAVAVLSLLLIWMYNGKPGTKNRTLRTLCYAFYPAHMLILSLIWLYILN